MTTLPPDEYAEFHTSRNRAAQEEITDLANDYGATTNVDEGISAFDAGHGGISQSQMSNPISGDEGHDDGSETNDVGGAGAD